MSDRTPEEVVGQPEWRGKPAYGYDVPAVQQGYAASEASENADFFLPHLRLGMSLLDCGCGPGTITLGLAEAVAPGRVVGVDLEPSMVQRANAIAGERQVTNLRFQVADICELPFPDGSFDAVFSSSVLEHLGDPVRVLKEMLRVLRPGGLIGVQSTDWTDPLISPADDAVKKFFELFEKGFNQYGGSLNRGRHLRSMLVEAGFKVVEYSARFNSSSTPEAVGNAVGEYTRWIENLPLFDQAVELGWVDRPTLQGIPARMMEWSRHPHAFLATARCVAVGQKE